VRPRRLTAPATVVAAGLAITTLARPAAAEDLPICSLKLAFSDDFSRFQVAPHVLPPGGGWTAHTPWNGDFGDAEFSDPQPDGPFFVRDGELQIVASKDRDGKWRSGLIAAADPSGRGEGLMYGYFEARMRFPPGEGTWPAFWLGALKPATDKSPSTEIDVVEYYGRTVWSYEASVHAWYDGAAEARSRHESKKVMVLPFSLVNDFHNYGVFISPQRLTFFLDGKPVWEAPTPPELTKPSYPLVNLALGAGSPTDHTPNPSVLRVKYVRMYSYDWRKHPAGCQPPLGEG